jgi:hypothetical protein
MDQRVVKHASPRPMRWSGVHGAEKRQALGGAVDPIDHEQCRWMLRLAAEPKCWMTILLGAKWDARSTAAGGVRRMARINVTAPVWASVRWSPACWIRNVAMTRWTICKTGAVVGVGGKQRAGRRLVLGVMYATGQSVARNIPEATKWLTRASEAGDKHAIRMPSDDRGATPDRRTRLSGFHQSNQSQKQDNVSLEKYSRPTPPTYEAIRDLVRGR